MGKKTNLRVRILSFFQKGLGFLAPNGKVLDLGL